MQTIHIRGGRPLDGEIRISGAKNAALPLIAATLLAPGEHILDNVPDLRDTRTMLHLLETLGAVWERDGTQVRIDTTRLRGVEAPYDLVRAMRASVLVLGPLLGRTGQARVSLPGGCAIGARPIDAHLSGFEQLGVRTLLAEGFVEARAAGRLQGAVIHFDTPTVTGTENVLMAAAAAEGVTEIRNAAREPEVGNLVDMLESMGARIQGRDTDMLVVHGVSPEDLGPARARIIPDRIESGTYLIAAAAAGGRLAIRECDPGHLPALTKKLAEAGLHVDQGPGRMEIRCPLDGNGRPAPLRNTDVRTMPYPGFATDLQAQFMALMVLADGPSLIHETIFENRFMHVAELRRMGADITVDGCSALVRGLGRKGRLTGAPVMATDLRASASLVIAALAARGETVISRIHHLERGYEDLVEKLCAAGAAIWKE